MAPSASDRQAKLLSAIDKLETLLVAANSRSEDFAFLWVRDVQLQLGQCWLSLAKLRRVEMARHPDAPASHTREYADYVEAVERARDIFCNPEVVSIKTFRQGYADLLVEEAENHAACRRNEDAVSTYARMIQLSKDSGGLVGEEVAATRIQALKAEMDTRARLDGVVQNSLVNQGEKDILIEAFTRLTAETNGRLHKEQIGLLATALGTQPHLTHAEVDEVWRQFAKIAGWHFDEKLNVMKDGVTFNGLWMWWMWEEMYSMNRRT